MGAKEGFDRCTNGANVDVFTNAFLYGVNGDASARTWHESSMTGTVSTAAMVFGIKYYSDSTADGGGLKLRTDRTESMLWHKPYAAQIRAYWRLSSDVYIGGQNAFHFAAPSAEGDAHWFLFVDANGALTFAHGTMHVHMGPIASIAGEAVCTNPHAGNDVQTSLYADALTSGTNMGFDAQSAVALRTLRVDTVSQVQYVYAKASRDLEVQVGSLLPIASDLFTSQDTYSFVKDQGSLLVGAVAQNERSSVARDLRVTSLLHSVPDGQMLSGALFGDGAGASGAVLLDTFAVQSRAFSGAGDGQTALRVRDLSGLVDLAKGDYVLVADASGNVRYRKFIDLLVENRWFLEQMGYFSRRTGYALSVADAEVEPFAPSILYLQTPKKYVIIKYRAVDGVVITEALGNATLISFEEHTANVLLHSVEPVPVGGAVASGGDAGISIAAAAITGMALVMHSSATYATSVSLSDGRVYASDYAAPTPTLLQSAIADRRAASADAAARRTSLDEYYEANDDVMQGAIGGYVFVSGVYSWVKDVNVASNVTLLGGPEDVFILRVVGTLSVAADVQMLLTSNRTDGALPLAKNVVWTIEALSALADSVLVGTIVAAASCVLAARAVVHGRLLADGITMGASVRCVLTT
ncbi:hypothetical protein T492DRAFT_833943 [Pavlovales sp. CCMP2436]|nr:hypothetical protein T492DRAFT_833943 [Pavlovales sp. CCMP2436]